MEGSLRAGSDDPDLRLIETALWDGDCCPRLDGHLARLRAGAAALGWPCDAAQAAAALIQAGRGPADQRQDDQTQDDQAAGRPARLRLTLDRQGSIAVTRSDLPPSPGRWRLALADARLRSDDPWLRWKTTRRAVYDRARATLAPDIDEVVFANERGEICDGTITTLFFDRGQGLATPPLSSGLLAGVLRAQMLASGQCREEVLLARDLPHLRLWVGNALRGLMPAVWAGTMPDGARRGTYGA